MMRIATFKSISCIKKVQITKLNHSSNSSFICSSVALVRRKWSYVSGPSEHPLIGKTIGEMLSEQTLKNPDKNAFTFTQQQVSLSFQELLCQSDKLAAGMKELGVKRGDRVGIWSSNCREWIITMFAAARAGFILVSINSSFEAPELQHCLTNVGVKVLLMVDKLKKSDNYEKLQKVCPSINKMNGPINDKNLPDLKHVIMIGEAKHTGTIPFSEVENMANGKLVNEIEDGLKSLQFDDAISIQFTSGTTGKPKGATLSHHNIINNALMLGYRLNFHQNETRICCPCPLFHAMGSAISIQTVVHSCAVIIPSLTFDPLQSIKAVQDERCTSIIGTPTMYIDFLNLPNLTQFDLSSLKNGICAGSVCPEEVMRRCVEKLNMSNMAIAYGTTENSPVTFQSLFHEESLEKRISNVGKVHDHVEAKVVDNENKIVKVGESGELWIRGYVVMKGYWCDDEKTNDTMHGNWYKTGDLAVIDEEGYCKIIGRKKDMIIRGGENVYPAEIEDVLHQHDNIKDVQIIGVPDERLGEQVAAWIILKDKNKTNEKDIVDFCKEKMAYFKVPKYISFMETFPMTATGKVQKFKMKEEAIRMYNLPNKKKQ